MGKKEKLLDRFKEVPSDFTWNEMNRLLRDLGYDEIKKKGKTGGSRVKFANDNKDIINLHKPHNPEIVKKYVIRQVITVLEERNEI